MSVPTCNTFKYFFFQRRRHRGCHRLFCHRRCGLGWNSPGVAQSRSSHSLLTMCFPACPAGCSHRDPSLWKAQHCLISFSIFPPISGVSGGREQEGTFPPLTFSTYQPLVGGTKTYSGRESISLLLCECLDESILVCRKIQLLMAVLVPILLAIFLWIH
jgi:hypothetical protein